MDMLTLRESLARTVKKANEVFNTNIGYVTSVQVKGDGTYHSRVTRHTLPKSEVYTLLVASLNTTSTATLAHEVAHIVCWELDIDQSGHSQEYMGVYYKLAEAMELDII